jgi:superoxide dismutase
MCEIVCVVNHEFFWRCMTPFEEKPQMPQGVCCFSDWVAAVSHDFMRIALVPARLPSCSVSHC